LPFELMIACDSLTDWALMLNALDSNVPTNITGYHDVRPVIDNPFLMSPFNTMKRQVSLGTMLCMLRVHTIWVG